jgi:FdhD protein
MDMATYRPVMSDAGLRPTQAVTAVDEYGEPREGFIAGERPLTLYLNKREIVTLMTLGTHPELLTLGYLLNQRLVPSVEAITQIHVDWDVESVAVTTSDTVQDLEERLSRRTVTTGCGQGTVFGRLTEQLEKTRVPETTVAQSRLYALLDALHERNEVYRRAGAVHGCALCGFDSAGAPDIELFVEDVGRHNAADAIAGHMWLNGVGGHDKVFYTTGRLTSEMVIKVAQMGVPVLVSRSGITEKGLEFARLVGVVMIARAKGRHFLVYNGAERVRYDALPPRTPPAARAQAHTGEEQP